MSTLLVLGSKPNPNLPPRSAYDELACANASGYSAAQHHLPAPVYTVMTAILMVTESGRQSLQVLAGLSTDTVYFLPKPVKQRGILKSLPAYFRKLGTSAWLLKWKLWSLSYRYRQFINNSYAYYDRLIRELCDEDQQILQLMKEKRPSTGVVAIALGIAQQKYERLIISGFSFELTHAYAQNPEITERGTLLSRHGDTDIAVIRYLATKHGHLYTTEPIVNERTGVPLLTDSNSMAQA